MWAISNYTTKIWKRVLWTGYSYSSSEPDYRIPLLSKYIDTNVIQSLKDSDHNNIMYWENKDFINFLYENNIDTIEKYVNYNGNDKDLLDKYDDIHNISENYNNNENFLNFVENTIWIDSWLPWDISQNNYTWDKYSKWMNYLKENPNILTLNDLENCLINGKIKLDIKESLTHIFIDFKDELKWLDDIYGKLNDKNIYDMSISKSFEYDYLIDIQKKWDKTNISINLKVWKFKYDKDFNEKFSSKNMWIVYATQLDKDLNKTFEFKPFITYKENPIDIIQSISENYNIDSKEIKLEWDNFLTSWYQIWDWKSHPIVKMKNILSSNKALFPKKIKDIPWFPNEVRSNLGKI